MYQPKSVYHNNLPVVTGADQMPGPVIVKGHKLGTLETIDQRYIEAHRYFSGLLKKLDCYSGHKAV